MQIIWIRMPAQRQKCKEPWIKPHQHKKTEVGHQPAPGKPYTEPTITVNGQQLKVVFQLLINSPTWEALAPVQCTLKMRSLSALQKSVWHLEEAVQMSGSEMEPC